MSQQRKLEFHKVPDKAYMMIRKSSADTYTFLATDLSKRNLKELTRQFVTPAPRECGRFLK